MSDTPVRVTFMLMAQDADRAKRFYIDGFAARITGAVPDGSWTIMEIAGTEVCLHGNGTGEIVDTGLAFEVDDLEQACTAIELAGGRVLRPKWTTPEGKAMDAGEWLAVVTDTEGNRITVVRRGGCFLHPSLFTVDGSPVER